MENSNFITERPTSAFSDISSSGFGKSNPTTKNCAYSTNILKPTSAFSASSSSGFVKSNQPSKFSTGFVHYTRDYPLGFVPNEVGIAKNDKCNGISDFHWRRKVGAVKSKIGNERQRDRNMIKKTPMRMKDEGERTKILEMLALFRQRCEEISRNEKDNTRRVDLKAMNELRKEGKIKNRCLRSSIIGPVPGIEIGDRFRYRVELVIAGLHKHYERGIDYTVCGGRSIATCVIAMEAHCDKMNDPNVLTYIGEGGKGGSREDQSCDQQLKGGNLALYESMKQKTAVRVVKGFQKDAYRGVNRRFVPRTEYVYDGLYEVIKCDRKQQGLLRKMMFEFKLFRCPGQPAVSWKRNRI